MVATFFAGMYERDESEDVGAGLVEYALLVALIALVVIGALELLGGNISALFTNIAGELG
jgi:pilus assembly protein Flp/PilA